MQVWDIIEIDGIKYRIVGAGTDGKKDYFNCRPADEKGQIIYKGGLKQILTHKKKGKIVVVG